jgi:hypothetical protein
MPCLPDHTQQINIEDEEKQESKKKNEGTFQERSLFLHIHTHTRTHIRCHHTLLRYGNLCVHTSEYVAQPLCLVPIQLHFYYMYTNIYIF